MDGNDVKRTHERRRRPIDKEARSSVLAEVATLYYVDRLTQEQIAQQLGRSVSMVSRMLAEAEATGVVEVRVRQPTPVEPLLQAELVRRFGLRVARVLRTSSTDPARNLTGIGELAARYLIAVITEGSVISVGWGTSLYEVVRAVPVSDFRDIHVVQSLGSLGSRLPQIDNHLITRMLADRLHGTPHFLPAPMIVESPVIRLALEQDPQLRETLALARRSDIALVGIGVPEADSAGMLRAGYVGLETLDAIREIGGVGDILVDFFDQDGQRRDVEISNRVIGMKLMELAAVPTVIAVAGGQFKARAILGALRLGVIDVLVTDDLTARAVLELAGASASDRDELTLGVLDDSPSVLTTSADR